MTGSVKKQSRPKAKAKAKTKTVESKPDVCMFTYLVEKYRDQAYKGNSGWEDFSVGLKMRILRETCSLQNLEWSCKIDSSSVTELSHTVHMVVTVSKEGTSIMTAHGISTQYSYDFVHAAKGTCSERAQTVSLGKALSMLGIALNNNLYSSEEMLTFKAMEDVDVSAHLNALAEKIYALDDEITTRIKNSGKRIRDFLKIYSEKDTEVEFRTKIVAYLDAESND